MAFFKAIDLLRLLEHYQVLKTLNKFDLLKIDSFEATRLRALYRKLEAEKQDSKDILLDVLGVLLDLSNWYMMERGEIFESFRKRYASPQAHAIVPFDAITKKALLPLMKAVEKAQRESQQGHSDSRPSVEEPRLVAVYRPTSAVEQTQKSGSIVPVPSSSCARFFQRLFRRHEQERPLLRSRTHTQSSSRGPQ